MDYRDIRPGHSICLKARHDGALLYLGDLHAYQGWGEWLGVGCECAGDVTISVSRDNFFISERPVIIKNDSYVCIASRVSYGEAIDLALHDAAEILKRMTGVSNEDAISYCKLAGNGMNGQMWHVPYPALFSKSGIPVSNFPCTVGMEIPTGILKQTGKIKIEGIPRAAFKNY
ncbi:MAG: acetamidase/formamidase family protein [Treponema sp.]|nr:acetamidase/formamidase family protein [Treponema sp.]